METIRYRPGDALRWLEIGAKETYKRAARQGASVIRREGERGIGRDIMQTAGALLDAGKGALTDFMHRQAEASEYAFSDDALEVITGRNVKSYPYAKVQYIRRSGDRIVVALDQGSVTIKPFAYIVAGKLRVPLGWDRNGMEVPYEMLAEELAARVGVNIQDS